MGYPLDFRSRVRGSRGRGEGFGVLCCPVRSCRVFRFLKTIKVLYNFAEPGHELKFEAH